MNEGEKNLAALIKSMQPHLHEGIYVFATLKNVDAIPRSMPIFEFKEAEGVSLILKKEDADQLQIHYTFEAAWITLKVHSALDAVGLTAAFSNALGEQGLSCNVIAGYYHDHIFVDKNDGQNAVHILKELALKA